MARWASRQLTITLEDANGQQITAGPGPGDLNIPGLTPENRERVRALDRGAFDGHFLGTDSEQEVSFTLELEDQTLSHATNARILDFILNARKGATALVSVNPNTDVWAFKLTATMTKGATTTTVMCPCVIPTLDFAEAGADAPVGLSFTGTNNGTIYVDGTAVGP